MEEKIFNLADVADPKSKVCLLPEYSLIKRKFFELAKPISEQKYTTRKFYEDHIIPHMTEDNYISPGAGRKWCEAMMPQAIKLTSMMQVHQEAQDVVTILEREQEKVKKQLSQALVYPSFIVIVSILMMILSMLIIIRTKIYIILPYTQI